jgi:hypothetical protein
MKIILNNKIVIKIEFLLKKYNLFIFNKNKINLARIFNKNYKFRIIKIWLKYLFKEKIDKIKILIKFNSNNNLLEENLFKIITKLLKKKIKKIVFIYKSHLIKNKIKKIE